MAFYNFIIYKRKSNFSPSANNSGKATELGRFTDVAQFDECPSNSEYINCAGFYNN